MKSQQSEDSPVELRRRLSDNAYTSNEERTVLSVPNPSAESDGLDRDGMSDIAGTPDSSLSSSARDETDSFLDSKVSATVKGDLRPRHSANFDFDRSPSNLRRRSIPVKLEKTGQAGRYLLTADDAELRNILRQGIEREESGNIKKRRFKYRDLVFTRQFTAFDRQNPASASSPFHGFFTLFWLGVGLMLIKVAANNWRIYGTVWGKNEILRLMFHKDVLVLGLTDGVLCGSTIFCLFLQRAIAKGFLSWNRSGWIIQNHKTKIWQGFYLGVVIWWTYHRDWPWTHTVFIVLHCLTMLMKQHSYAFYNGYLSELYRKRKLLEAKLLELESLDTGNPATQSSSQFAASCFGSHDLSSLRHRRHSFRGRDSPEHRGTEKEISAAAEAIESGAPLDLEQIQSFQRLIEWEIDSLTEELKGQCLVTDNHYPKNLTIGDFYGFIPLPTLIYELEYPRQEKINWVYVAEKTAATFGVIGVMIAISQAWIYPVVMSAVQMKKEGLTLHQRLKEFPWVLSDLIFPFMMEYLLTFYVIWECVLNALAEITRFADRGFYADWWNSVSWDQFARDWNRPVHNFLLRHVYHSSISAFNLSRSMATLVTFLLSACVHELIMLCIFRQLRGYLLMFQMLQLPLVSLSRTSLLRGRRTLGNVIFWLGIFTGPSLLCSLYLII